MGVLRNVYPANVLELRRAKRVAKEEAFIALELEAKLAAATLRMEVSAMSAEIPCACLLSHSHLLRHGRLSPLPGRLVLLLQPCQDQILVLLELRDFLLLHELRVLDLHELR